LKVVIRGSMEDAMSARLLLFAVAATLGGLTRAGADVFTVGPGGAYATIQSAVDAAIAAGGNNDVKVGPGTYPEHLTVPVSFASGSLVLSGGWNAAFTQRSPDPALTVVDGSGSGRGLEVCAAGRTVVVLNLTLTHGAASYGAGALVNPAGAAWVVIGGCRIADNVTTAFTAVGGGSTWRRLPAPPSRSSETSSRATWRAQLTHRHLAAGSSALPRVMEP
jgi:hypothetical protein